MSAIGPNTAPKLVGTFLPICSQQITVGAADVAMSTLFNCGIARRAIAQAAGTVFLQLAGDPTAVSYVLTAGQSVDGEIVLVGGTTNYPSATAIKVTLQV